MTAGAARGTPSFTVSSRRTGGFTLAPLECVNDVIHLLTVFTLLVTMLGWTHVHQEYVADATLTVGRHEMALEGIDDPGPLSDPR